MIERQQPRKAEARRGEAMILFTVAGQRFAVSASAVEEIRNTAGLRPLVSGFSAHAARVKFFLVRDGRTYLVVDANVHLQLLPSVQTRVLVMRNSRCALLVEAIERMAEIPALFALPRGFEGEERNWYRGLTLIGEDVVPVLNAKSLLTASDIAAAESQLESAKAAIA